MKSPRSQVVIIAQLAIAFLLGVGFSCAAYFLFVDPNRGIQSSDAVGSIPSNTRDSNSSDPSATRNVAKPIDATKRTQWSIGHIEEIESPFDRLLALRSQLARTDETGVLDLLAESLDLSYHARSREIQAAIVQRLAQINPSRALSVATEMDTREPSYSGELVEIVFREWAGSDLNEAVASVRQLSERVRQPATNAILLESMNLPRETLLSIARQIGNEHVAETFITQLEVEEAVRDPEERFSELVGKLQDDSQNTRNIARVATAWIEKSGLGRLDQIRQLITNSQTRVEVTREVLRNAVQTDPLGALEYTLKLREDPNNSTRTAVVYAWTLSDPQSALSAVSEISQKTLRKELESFVVGTWAMGEPNQVLENIDSIPPRHRELAITTAIRFITWDSPEIAARLITEMESGSTKLKAARDVVFNWSQTDPTAALEWILSEPAIEEMQPQLLSSVIGMVADADPDLAWTIAREQPIPEGEFGMELRVIGSLLYQNADKALEFLPQVREGRTRLEAYCDAARVLVQDRDFDTALSLLSQVSGSDRTDVFQSIAAAWARSDAEGLLDSMERFDTPEFKSKAAMALVLANRYWTHALSDKQIGEAKSFLTDEDKELLEESNDSTFSGW